MRSSKYGKSTLLERENRTTVHNSINRDSMNLKANTRVKMPYLRVYVVAVS
jgi:hypothetical protein